MAKETRIDLFRTNDHTWTTLRLYGSRNYQVVRTLDGRYYVWVDDVIDGRSLWGVYETFEQARRAIAQREKDPEEAKVKKKARESTYQLSMGEFDGE